ncbi:MAG: hypothetical protein ACREFR_11550 [Limisphaerales bacterium]
MSVRPLLQFWLWISAFAALAGWTLSAIGHLNRPGYGTAFAIFALFIVLKWRTLGFSTERMSLAVRKAYRRFRRPLPLCFLVLAVLVFMGGALYWPTHYAALTYHIPRVLQWLAAGRWHWIHTPVVRMNYTGCDFEWLFAPLILFTKSDRTIFILNFIPFLFLPGLVFSVFTRLGVHPRVSRQWMWLLPTGYSFLLQAGSAGNDFISAFYALVAFDFALRARFAFSSAHGAIAANSAIRHLWQSLLAMALLTGTKPVSVPLLLPWLILVCPSLPVLARRWFATVPVALVALAVSFFPSALMNKLHCGDWLGASIEPSNVDVKNPLTGVLANGFELLQVNLAPPVFPWAHLWDEAVARTVPRAWLTTFQSDFFTTGELPTEDWAGIGFGLTALLAVSVVAGLVCWNCRPPLNGPMQRKIIKTPHLSARLRWMVLIGPWMALLIYCAKAGMATPGRLIAPYYPLLLPLLLVGRAQAGIVRRAWWRACAGLVVFLAFVVLILSPDRPLWPVQTVLSRVATWHPKAHWISRARDVYAVYAGRSDPLADVRALLPPRVKVVGFIGGPDDSDISLWLPFGSRRVEHFLLSDPPERFRREHVEYVVIGELTLEAKGVALKDWLTRNGAVAVGAASSTFKVSQGPQRWYVTKIKRQNLANNR